MDHAHENFGYENPPGIINIHVRSKLQTDHRGWHGDTFFVTLLKWPGRLPAAASGRWVSDRDRPVSLKTPQIRWKGSDDPGCTPQDGCSLYIWWSYSHTGPYPLKNDMFELEPQYSHDDKSHRKPCLTSAPVALLQIRSFVPENVFMRNLALRACTGLSMHLTFPRSAHATIYAQCECTCMYMYVQM